MALDFFHDLNMQEITKTTCMLFAVIDMLGMIPLLVKTKQVEALKPGKTTLTVGFIGFLFLFFGHKLLWVYNLDLSDFQAAGGLVLAVLGLELLFNLELSKIENTTGISSSVTPLGFPIIAGTGTLTTLILLQEHYKIINVMAGFFLNLFIIYAVIRYVDWIERLLGRLLLSVATKTIGLLLLSMGFQFIKHGFQG